MKPYPRPGQGDDDRGLPLAVKLDLEEAWRRRAPRIRFRLTRQRRMVVRLWLGQRLIGLLRWLLSADVDIELRSNQEGEVVPMRGGRRG